MQIAYITPLKNRYNNWALIRRHSQNIYWQTDLFQINNLTKKFRLIVISFKNNGEIKYIFMNIISLGSALIPKFRFCNAVLL